VSEDEPIFEPGDVVFGADPFKGTTAARPWLVVSNHEGRPFHGEQYIALTLTTKSWHDGLIEIDPDDWVQGGTPDDSRTVPWAVQSITHDDIDRWQGRLRRERVAEAVDALQEEFDV
jgi:mRNA-degrading endonuclease toxin of MazEF toxin-antitoxin module